MHHVVLEQWSRRESFLHRRDPRAKTAVLLIFLILLATAEPPVFVVGLAYLAVLCGATVWARLPVFRIIARAAVVLPFALMFAAVTWLTGDHNRALALVVKSYISAFSVLLLVSTTPLPHLLRGLDMLRVPNFLLMVAQFLYRYLFVISEEAQHMRVAASVRGGIVRELIVRRDRFRAAVGILAMLFARSYSRAETIHRCMVARGFQGQFRLISALHFDWKDAAFFAISSVFAAALRWAAGGRIG